jgi:hypothetical protein
VGLKNIKTTARNGKVVALEAVQNKDDLMLITAQGMVIRTGLDQIRSIGRNTQGVRLIKLKAGDTLVAAEKIASEDANNAKGKSRNNQESQPKSEANDEQESINDGLGEPESINDELDEPEPKPTHNPESKPTHNPKPACPESRTAGRPKSKSKPKAKKVSKTKPKPRLKSKDRRKSGKRTANSTLRTKKREK